MSGSNNPRFGTPPPNKGQKIPEERRLKIQKALKANPPFLGRHHTEEWKTKMSMHFKGRTAWNKGKPFSKETRKKMREAALRRFAH